MLGKVHKRAPPLAQTALGPASAGFRRPPLGRPPVHERLPDGVEVRLKDPLLALCLRDILATLLQVFSKGPSGQFPCRAFPGSRHPHRHIRWRHPGPGKVRLRLHKPYNLHTASDFRHPAAVILLRQGKGAEGPGTLRGRNTTLSCQHLTVRRRARKDCPALAAHFDPSYNL